jgi:CTP:molybdopterin cytidylyltransferase MocA
MISGVILASDETSKVLLKDSRNSAQTILHQIVDVLIASRVLENVIVLQGEAVVIQNQLEWFKGKVMESEMKEETSAILMGIHALEQKDLHGIILWPANSHPVNQKVVVDLLHLFWTRHKPIVATTRGGGRGYPVIIGKEIFPEFESTDPNVTIDTILWRDPDRVYGLEVFEEDFTFHSEAAKQ